MSVDVSVALVDLRQQLQELEEVERDTNPSFGLAHLSRWKTRTKSLVARHISQQEAEVFDPSGWGRLPGNSNPRVELKNHAEHYRGRLLALVRDLERNGERFVLRDAEPSILAPASVKGEEGDSHKVFVVHGRNNKARDAMFTFLRSLKLDPMEWNDAMRLTGEATPYIGRVLDVGFAACRAAVILLTGDDEARLRQDFLQEHDEEYERQLTPQPRPNVIFEAGYAFGRFEARTILVEIGRMRPFSDVVGRHTVRLRDTPQARQDLKSRLETAGCIVDVPGVDWLSAGDFKSALDIGS